MSTEPSTELRGSLIAMVLAGAWRRSPTPLEISEKELLEVTPLLLKSGAAALAWRKVSHSELRGSPAAMQLADVSRLYALHALLLEREIARVVTLLRSSGIEAILIKGWAAARLYPQPTMRRSTDIDLVVRAEQYKEAENLRRSQTSWLYPLDFEHREITEFDDQTFDELYARSQLVRLGEMEVRVPGPEDHLRILCIHMLKHSVQRPRWLCDVAVALESLPAKVDWELCLSRNHRRASWVACAIGLAQRLLGARVNDAPILSAADNLPNWLVPAVLRQWGWRLSPGNEKLCIPALLARLREPRKLLEEVRARWDRPIAATMALHLPFNQLPRMPFQLVASVLSIPELTQQLWRSRRNKD